jgi:hypothetical protein
VVGEVRGGQRQSVERSRLALWSRRLLGEAITQAQYVLAQRDELVDLVVAGTAAWAAWRSSSSGCSARTASG